MYFIFFFHTDHSRRHGKTASTNTTSRSSSGGRSQKGGTLMHSASCPFKVNLSLWPSISSSICLSSKNTCDTAVLESFEGTKNCHVNIILIRNDYVDLCHLSQRPKKQTSFRQIQDSCDWHIHTYLIKKRNDNGVAPA